MDHNHADQEWNKLETHINQMTGRYLRDGLDQIEYNPRYAIRLLETSFDERKDQP